MIIWLFLFLVIVVISFILAYRSMQGYQEDVLTPQNGIFLVREIEALDSNVLKNLHQRLLKGEVTISLERLFKGSKQAYIMVCPKEIVNEFPELELLELEDFATDPDKATIWEVGTKDQIKLHLDFENQIKGLAAGMPELQENEQFWIQFLLLPKKGKLWPKLGKGGPLQSLGLLSNVPSEVRQAAENPTVKDYIFSKGEEAVFQAQIRAVVVADSEERRQELSDQLVRLSGGILIKVPRPLTGSQIFGFYKSRTFLTPDVSKLSFTNGEISKLLQA